MSLAAVALLVCLSSIVAARPAAAPSLGLPANASNLTYGELATFVVPPALDAMQSLLPSLTPGVMPTDVKPVRKSVLALRNMLDVFSFAYPDSSKHFKGDPLVYVRDMLDSGYETIGHFQDLVSSGVNFTKKEVITRRCSVLSWEADFEAASAAHNFSGFIDSPKPKKLETDRKESHMSSFFWGKTGIVPSEKDTGLQTVSKLTKALLKIASDDLHPLKSIDNLNHNGDQQTMHDYRKQLRGILAIAAALPVFTSSSRTDSDIGVLSDTYDSLGDCEDLVNAYEFEQEHGNKASQKSAETKLQGQWDATRASLKGDGLEAAIVDLLANMVKY